MTEAQWLTYTDPVPMLEFLQGRVSERKLRLFAFACCIRVLRYLQGGIKVLVRQTEQVAETPEGEARLSGLWRWHYVHRHGCEWISAGGDPRPYLYAVSRATAALARAPKGRRQLERDAQTRLLCCIFRNPFRPCPPLPAAVLTWREGLVLHIAQTIHEGGKYQNLPILADALEDAGCDDEDLLRHCRGEGPHVRGCWVVDLLLGKE